MSPLLEICQRNNLQIKWCENLDSGDVVIDAEFRFVLKPIVTLYDNPGECIINMDESGISTNRRFRFVIPNGYFPGMECRQHHICAFSATGKLFWPGVIIPSMQTTWAMQTPLEQALPSELATFGGECDIYTSKAGWMTRNASECWCVNFAHEGQAWVLCPLASE